jgi:hypothetical protein
VLIPQDALFRKQREQYRFRFTCEHCVLFEEDSGGCAHGFPTAQHREAVYEDENAPLVFCKHFELA